MKTSSLKHVRVLIAVGVAFGALVSSGCGSATTTSLLYNDENASAIRDEFAFGGGGGGAVADAAKFTPDWEPKWGTLKGVFKVSGDVQKLSRIATPKEKQFCGDTYPNEIYEIGANGGLRNVVIYLNEKLPTGENGPSKWIHDRYDIAKVEASGASVDSLLPQQKREVLFDQKQCVFLSHAFAMRTGQTMLVKNSDGTTHNTNMSPKKNRSANFTLPSFGSDVYTPEKEETEPFRVSCSVHPWMYSMVIFRDSPYFAVTDENGKFEIPDVPAGVELEFRVWHENLKWVGPSTVENGPGDWSRGKFKIQLEDGKTKDMTVTIDGSLLKAG